MDTRSRLVKVETVVGSAAKALVLAACLAGTTILGQAAPAIPATVEVKVMQTPAGKTYFDPAGVRITARPSQTCSKALVHSGKLVAWLMNSKAFSNGALISTL